jgi:hypothetical protein
MAELQTDPFVSMRQLSECHTEPLVPARESPQLLICPIASNTLLKFAVWKKLTPSTAQILVGRRSLLIVRSGDFQIVFPLRASKPLCERHFA